MHEIQKFDINHMAAITEVKCPINSSKSFLNIGALIKKPTNGFCYMMGKLLRG